MPLAIINARWQRATLPAVQRLQFRCGLAVLASVIVGASGSVCGQNYPTKPLRFILPYPPGGVTDVIARLIGQKMTETLGQPVIIDQRGGGASILGTELAAKSAADGYTLLLGTFGFAITPALHKKLPYDTLRDFAAVGRVANGMLALVVHPTVPAHTVKELVALARTRPGQLNFGSTGGGSSSNLGAALFQSLTGVRMTGISYKGAGPSLTALLAGDLHLIFSSMLPALPHIRTGRLRALGVSSAKRSPVLPHVPTLAEAGVNGYELISWYGVLAPGATPPPVVSRLNQVVTQAVQNTDVQEKLIAQGLEPATSTPAEFSKFIATEVAKWSVVIRQIGVVHE
jgi:tripartite-type tricarboxylate transporter receptor subunit TctC